MEQISLLSVYMNKQNKPFYVPNFMGRIRNIHLVGIGGSGMCGIAEVLVNLGYTVSGSDVSENRAVQHLRTLGVNILLEQKAENVTNADVVVASTAIKQDNPEIVAAHQGSIPVVPRAEMLSELMRFRYGIAVAGTHGKTTTTSLIASILAEGGLDPTYVIGGRLNSSGSNAKLGASEYLVAEADESDASFLHLQPMMSVVTNIDRDHMETYDGDMEKLRQTFIEFLHNLPFYGLAILCIDDPIIGEILPHVSRPMITYGFSEDADISAFDYVQQGCQNHFKVKRTGLHNDLDIEVNIPGNHNVLNTLAAIGVATELGVSDRAISDALASFEGIDRRFQNLGQIQLSKGQVTLIDDYGHHPREVAATIQAARSAWPDRRLVMIYQPHRYTRTRNHFEAFVEVLSTVDELILLDVYSAGETPIPNINSETLAKKISQQTNTKVSSPNITTSSMSIPVTIVIKL